MKYHIDWLKELTEQEEKIKYLFFWGHQPSINGELTETCFSQWWKGHSFSDNVHTYKTSEHYMMAKKAELFKDQEFLDKILQAESPGEAKKFGRMVRNFDQEVWEAERCKIVVAANFLKFGQNQELKDYLLKTNNRVIV